MTDKRENYSLAELKKEVLIAYLNLQIPGMPIGKKEELNDKYEEARKQLAERIATELT